MCGSKHQKLNTMTYSIRVVSLKDLRTDSHQTAAASHPKRLLRCGGLAGMANGPSVVETHECLEVRMGR